MQEIHPEYHPVIFKDGEHEIVTRSTATSDQTREVDGVEHHVINVDISAFTHPFYTGQQTLVDTEGRVDRFKKRYNLEDDDEESSDEAEASDEGEASDEAETSDDDDASEDVEASEDEESSDDEE